MRTHTPPRIRYDDSGNETGRTMKVQRACNGCHREIGDVTDEEIDAAMNGLPLPDARSDCPWCAPFLTEEVSA